MKKIHLFLFALLLAVPAAGHAEEKPFQAALINPVQIVNEAQDIKGLRLNLIYGVNEDVSGVDLGLGLGRTAGEFKGLGWHWFGNMVEGKATGIQWAEILNITEGDFKGWQSSAIPMTRGSFEGFQHGFVPYTATDFLGVQLGAVTITGGDFKGVQVGFVNLIGGSFRGLQLGIFNKSEIVDGLQIGLINVNDNKKPFPVLPFVNWKF